MLGFIGKKVGMSSIYDSNGFNIPCTVIWSDGCFVTQIKTDDIDGYNSVQLSFGSKKANVESPLIIKEIRDFEKEVQLGQKLLINDLFTEGDVVNVIGTSKGKGFQGVVKRHKFSGVGGQTHGQHNRLRAPGSVGASSFPSRVFKGLRMAGRTGGDRVTVKNLKVLKVIPEENLIVIKGCVPGDTDSIVILNK